MAPYQSQGSLTTDKRTVDDTTTWESQADWEAYQSASNVEIVNGAVQLAQTSIPDPVTNRWQMDEGSGQTLVDSIGSRDLDVNGASWGSSGYLTFNGSGDYASHPNDNSYFSDLGDFSLFCWFNADNLSDRHTWASVYDPGGDNRAWSFWYDGSNINLNTSTDGANFTQASVTYSPTANAWHSIAITRDASTGDVIFYLDGTEIGTGNADSGNLHASIRDFYVGARTDGSDWWDGNIYEMNFAKGAMLSASEIQTLHDNTDPR